MAAQRFSDSLHLHGADLEGCRCGLETHEAIVVDAAGLTLPLSLEAVTQVKGGEGVGVQKLLPRVQ